MPTLLDYLFNRNLKSQLPEKAHFSEKQWIHPDLTWKEGTAALKTLFPRDARPERPKEWYRLLQETHWAGQVTPGNGPFYVPDWAIMAEEYEAAENIRNILKGANFKDKEVPLALLPANSEYLHVAMRVVETHRWNVDPMLYRVYWYPWLKTTKSALRNFSTHRWGTKPTEGDSMGNMESFSDL